MSAPSLQPAPPRSPSGRRLTADANRRPPQRFAASRIPLVILLILSLIGAGFARHLAALRRGATVHVGETNSTTPLSRMDSFALALLLGGLRGPLVMILWTSSESQKQDKDLDDFDTKVEWIRLLQPEFDTVHIFQIWNKAYNISALKASLPNKYLAIIDALDYATKVNRERPDDINIVYAFGNLYFDKLDQSAEKDYYRQRVRAETQPHTMLQPLKPTDPAWRPLELQPMLDSRGYLLPDELTPTKTLLVDPKDPSRKYDGSELPFLAPYQPFPDGIPPVALGYNYLMRAALLQSLGHQRHAQLGEMVIDSRPALAQKFWSEEELERGRRIELEALGKPIPTERNDLEQAADAVPLDTPLDEKQRAALSHARDIYALSSRLATDSLNDFRRHVSDYKESINMDRLQMDTLAVNIDLAAGDRDYLSAMLAHPSARPSLIASARQEYQRALLGEQLMVLQYYVSDQWAREMFPAGYNRDNLDKLKKEKSDQIGGIVEEVKRRLNIPGQYTDSRDDIDECFSYIGRMNVRLGMLGT